MTSHFWQGTGILYFTVLITNAFSQIIVKSLGKGKGKGDRNPNQLFIGLSFSLEVPVPLRTYFSLSFKTPLQHPTQNAFQGLSYVR